jgi:hypothetical protein
MQGYAIYEALTASGREAQRAAAMLAREADQRVHAYRKKQQGVNLSFTLNPAVDRVLQDSPGGAGWHLSRAQATLPLYLDEARLAGARRLPQVEKLLKQQQWVTCNHHWDKAQGVGYNMKGILDRLGAVLEPSSMEGVEGSEKGSVFSQPLQYERRGCLRSEVQEACMRLSEAKVAMAKGMYQPERRGYVKVTLGNLRGRSITEWGHRLVLWAVHGPPASPEGWTTSGPHCLHMCGQKDCLNPSHLVWGTAQDNRDDEERVYVERLREQGRHEGGQDISGGSGEAARHPGTRRRHMGMAAAAVRGGSSASGGSKRPRRHSALGPSM